MGVELTDRDSLSSVSTFHSSDNIIKESNFTKQSNSPKMNRKQPAVETNNINHNVSTTNIFNNFFNASNSTRLIESISEEPLNITIQHSVDPATINKIDHYQVKIKNDFGLSVNLNLKKSSEEND